MADDPLTAMAEAIDRRAAEDTTSLDEARRERTADSNHPWKPEQRRPPRGKTPDKWAPPPYRDREAERLVGRLDNERKRR